MSTPTARELVTEAKDIGFTAGEIATLTKIIQHLAETPDVLLTKDHMYMYCEMELMGVQA